MQATYTPHKDEGFFVSGNTSHPYQGGKDRIKIAGSLDIFWNVHKDEGSGEDVEVFVEPAKDYENWIPNGNEDNAKNPGPDPLELTVTVHKIGDSKEIRKAFLSISLPYVSKNPGVSGNWPKNADEEEGLRFLESDFPKEKGCSTRIAPTWKLIAWSKRQRFESQPEPSYGHSRCRGGRKLWQNKNLNQI